MTHGSKQRKNRPSHSRILKKTAETTPRAADAIYDRMHMGRGDRTSTDLCATGKACPFVHGEDGGGDVAIDDCVVGKVAAIAVHITVHMSEDLDVAGLDISLDIGKLTDNHLSGLRLDLAINFPIDVHIVLKPDGADDLYAGG